MEGWQSLSTESRSHARGKNKTNRNTDNTDKMSALLQPIKPVKPASRILAMG
jgi:hypothetical protein